MIDYVAIGKRIRYHRRDRDITQAQLASLIGCSTSYVGLIERGQRVLSVETLCRLADALNLSTDYLLGRTETTRPD